MNGLPRPDGPPRIALGGPMGVGKSTVGRLVAGMVGVPFVDLDRDLGDIPRWFREQGEASFRDAETEALRARVHAPGVIALGGGALIRGENRQLLAEWTVVVLMATEATLEARLTAETQRPLAPRWRGLLHERAATWSAFGQPLWTDQLDTTTVAELVVRRCRGERSR